MTRTTDQPIEKLLPNLQFLAEMGALAYLRWTCPKCGDRVLADTPNVYNALGYTHTERADGTPCRGFYAGPLFGLAVLVDDVPLTDAWEKTKDLPPEVRERIAVLLGRSSDGV